MTANYPSQSELNNRLRGSIVALVTPMFAGEKRVNEIANKVDFDALADLIEWHVQSGTNAIVAMGTTAESATLNTSEHIEVIKFIVEKANGRIPIIGGTGANSTAEAIELTQAAGKAGVDACLLVSPYYNKPTQAGLYQHHVAVAEATGVPQILYNVPGRTAVDMLPDTVAKLSTVDTVVGIKEATGDVSRAVKIRELVADDFIVLSGDDASFIDLIEAGATGNISVTANVAPAAMKAVCDAALQQNFEQARSINEPLTALHSDLFLESNPIPVKYALHAMGKMSAGIRLPLTPLAECYHEQVNKALDKASINIK